MDIKFYNRKISSQIDNIKTWNMDNNPKTKLLKKLTIYEN